MGAATVEMPMVPMRLGEASSMLAAAEAAVTVGCDRCSPVERSASCRHDRV